MVTSSDTLKRELKELTEIHGVAGSEIRVEQYLADKLCGTKAHVYSDAMGNLIAETGEGSYKVGVYAHMDEVGLIVRRISPLGLIYFDIVGNIDERVMPGSEWDILTTKGTIVRGVIGNKSRHLQNDADKAATFTYRDFAIDVGASNLQDVQNMGIQVGCPIAFPTKCTFYDNGAVLAKALDNRIACLILLEAIRRLDGQLKNIQLCGFFTAQEEIGARGAKVVGFGKGLKASVTIDTLPVQNYDHAQFGEPELNKGPDLRLVDWHPSTKLGMFSNKKLVELIKASAEHKNIPYQTDVITGTFLDSCTAHLSEGGIPGCSICIPRRYSHTAVELSHWSDINYAIDLLCEFLTELDQEPIQFGHIYQ